MGELEYLKRIADALQKMLGQDNSVATKTASALGTIAEKIGTTNIEAINVSQEGNTNLADIDGTLHTGLIGQIENDGVTSDVAFMQMLHQAVKTGLVGQVESGGQTTDVAYISMLNDTLKKGLVYSYQDNGATVEKGLAQLISETKTVLEDIKKALDGTTANGVAKQVEAVATALGTTNNALGNIQTNTANTADRLIDGSNVSVATKLGTITSNQDTEVIALSNIQTNTGNTADRLKHGSYSAADLLNYIDNEVDDVESKLEDIKTNQGTINSSLGTIDSTLGTIKTDTASIDGKIQ